MKIKLTILVLLIGTIVFGQTSDPKLPSIVPASPEASAIAKNGQMSVGMFSGIAQAAIPLYEIKAKGIPLSIGLSYSGNGLKVDEIPSRVGLGWILDAGGVVTRSVHDKPDDEDSREIVNTNFPYPNDSTLTILKHKIGNSHDAEPDEFQVNGPGVSAKFIIDNSGNVVQIPYSNLKIEVIKVSNKFSEFIVTNTEGVKFSFGGTGAFENTISHTFPGPGLSGVQNIRTGFYLKKIEAPNGESITFNYTAITFTTHTSVSHSVTKRVSGSNDILSCLNGCGAPCAAYNSSSFSEDITSITYASCYLSSITSSSGESISFNYQDRPDSGQDNRVSSIAISANQFSKTYYFNYIDSAGWGGNSLNSANQRFFLKEVYSIIQASETATPDTLRYTCNYNELSGLPGRLSNGQDWFGFYNGATSNSNLLPSTYSSFSNYATASRTPNAQYAKKGMLQRITFPTGGFEAFDYESHYYATQEQVSTQATKSVTGSGNSSSGGSYQATIWYSQNFTINLGQTANVSLQCYANPGCSGCSAPPANTMNLAKLEIINLTTSTVISTEIMRDYSTYNFNVSLSSSYTYQLKLTVWGLPNAATAQIGYDSGNGLPQYVWVNKELGGLRVKSVESYDPVSAKSTFKYFKYTQSISSTLSSGRSWYTHNFLTNNNIRTMCPTSCMLDVPGGGQTPSMTCMRCYTDCYFQTLSSHSSVPMFLYNNSLMGYSSVIESDDPNFANGSIQHLYNTDAIITGETLNGQPNYYLPSNTTTTLTGKETGTKYFSKTQQLLKEQKNYYRVDSSVNIVYKAHTISIKYTNTSGFLYENPVQWTDVLDIFNISRYQYISNWIKLDSTVNIDYDVNNNSLTLKTTYYYGTSANTQPIKTESANSTGETITTEMKYPGDYGTTPYTTMVTKNIISPTVETKQKRGTSDLSLIRNNYKQWYSSGSILIIEPEYITAKKGANSEESRIRYYAYDETGNPLEVSKENGSHITYLWGYNKKYPVAEFKNATALPDSVTSLSSVAYTSFEAGDKGNWEYSGHPKIESLAPTGISVYDLDSGNITKGISPMKVYYITYWIKNGSGTIGINTSTTSRLLVTRNNWSCYEHKLENSEFLSIGGTGTIDELRLYPVGSYVTTFTYSPNIGITSRNEPNNQITYYEYDGGFRLKIIRDGDRNIIKQYEYQYKKQITPCSSTTANWVETGVLRCVKTTDHTNNNTGVQEKQERDMNNCSSTYLQTRWVSLGTNGQCPPVSNCTAADKRVINGVCTTGSKILVASQQISLSQWLCTYHYVWSDGFVGADFTETSSTSCGTPGGGGGGEE